MTRLRALVGKELAVLFASPVAYLVLFMVALVTALVFFDHLRIYNQILFVFASTTMGGFESDTIPDHINLRDTVFYPVMEQLGLLLIAPLPLVTMRVFAEERARGTDELLSTTGLSPLQIVLGKFAVTFAFVLLMMVVSFVYPMTAIVQAGVGVQHLVSVFLGLTLLALGIASLGLVCSALTSSQLIAAASAWALAFVLYDFSWLNPFLNEDVARLLDQIAMHPRFGVFAEGVVQLGDVAYFAALAGMAMGITRFILDWRRFGVGSTRRGPMRLALVGVIALAAAFGAQRTLGETSLFTSLNALGGAVCLAAAALLLWRHQRASAHARAPVADTVARSLAVVWGAVLAVVAASAADVRFDMTLEGRYELAPATREAIARLAPDGAAGDACVALDLYRDAFDPRIRRTRQLLAELGRAGCVRVSDRLLDDVPEEADRYEVASSNTVVVRHDGHFETVARPTEGALFEALSRLARRETQRVLYVTAGSGEGDVLDSGELGFSGFAAALQTEGYRVRSLTTAFVREIPEDADAVVVLAPERALRAEAIAALDRYLARGGSVLAWLEPGHTTGIEDWLARYGLGSPNRVVVDPSSAPLEGDPPGVNPLVFNYWDHPARRGLNRNRMTFFRGARPIEPRRPQEHPDADIKRLVTSSGDAWLHPDPSILDRRQDPERPPGTRSDYWTLAATGRYPLPAGEARLAVFGDSDFGANRNLRALFNLDLALNTVHWLLEREADITLRPKSAPVLQFPLPIQNSLKSFSGLGLLIPEALLLLAAGAWLRRQSS
ncbi:MAG: Gldg family protein [Proteobacteria bacterium]|nr:Gldg family protein [Pseudomonadota bacterium]